MISRVLSLEQPLKHRSVFLFGPRQTGKSTFLRTTYPQARFYDLLESDTYRDLSNRPELLRLGRKPGEDLIVIDEIQRIPALLNEVHTMIERNPEVRFIMTGSSARSLRKGGVNLLGGRAHEAHLFPFVSPELGYNHLEQRLNTGSMPSVFTSPRPYADLRSYVGTYLQEEIRAEGLVRSMEAFSRFLDVAALSNGGLINFTEVGSDAGVPPRTVREHFQLLEDTLIGHMLPPFQATVKRKPVATSKFYLFDVGLAHHLMHRSAVSPGSPEYGQALEHQIFIELKAYLSYHCLDLPLTFWRTHAKFEVDFVIDGKLAIEVKSAERVHDRNMKGIRALAEEVPLERKILICHERSPWKTEDGIEVIPVDQFLRSLWAHQIIGLS